MKIEHSISVHESTADMKSVLADIYIKHYKST